MSAVSAFRMLLLFCVFGQLPHSRRPRRLRTDFWRLPADPHNPRHVPSIVPWFCGGFLVRFICSARNPRAVWTGNSNPNAQIRFTTSVFDYVSSTRVNTRSVVRRRAESVRSGPASGPERHMTLRHPSDSRTHSNSSLRGATDARGTGLEPLNGGLRRRNA